MQKYLIAGLGNPEKKYEKTRHNIGFEVVKAFAIKHQMKFSNEPRVKGLIAQTSIDEKKIYLLMPLTYMNESGVSIKLCLEFYKIDISNVIIIVDDVAIDFGEFRIRTDSGSGGHNGLKSIEHHLKTNAFPRLRFGVGNRQSGELTSYVLGSFSQEETKELPQLVDKAVNYIEVFLKQGLTQAMNLANIKKQNKESIE